MSIHDETEADTRAELKKRFHVVKLAMFNAQLLSSVQREAEANASGVCKALVDACARENGHPAGNVPSSINQSLFFGMAYLSMVWLWESLSENERKQALGSAKMNGVWEGVKTCGPRDVESDWQKFRLVRNALSHANVNTLDPFDFEFWDQNGRRPNEEPTATYLRMSSESLGSLATRFYYSVSDVIYQ